MQEDTVQTQSPDEPYIGRDRQLPPSHSRPHRSMTARILVWLLILLAFGIIFWFVLHHRQTQKAATGRRAMTGPVTLTTVTAKKGNIGVYLDAIGTVTPVYTDTITSQVTGMISDVHYRE